MKKKPNDKSLTSLLYKSTFHIKQSKTFANISYIKQDIKNKNVDIQLCLTNISNITIFKMCSLCKEKYNTVVFNKYRYVW